jgi:hypothetical protein
VPEGEEDVELLQLFHLPVVPLFPGPAGAEVVGPGDSGPEMADLELAHCIDSALDRFIVFEMEPLADAEAIA